VVATPPDDDSERPEKSVAELLVEQARADGVDLVGPGGLLAGLTKQVLETGLEIEMEEHRCWNTVVELAMVVQGENVRLGRWAIKRRVEHKKGKLSPSCWRMRRGWR